MYVEVVLLKCRQMSTQAENGVSHEDLLLPQLISPAWSDDDNVDTLRRSASPPTIDRSANCCTAFLCALPKKIKVKECV